MQTVATFLHYCGGQNAPSIALQTSHSFAVVKTHSPKFCNPHTLLADVKTHSTNRCKLPTYFAVVKTHSPNKYNPPECFEVVKTDSPKYYKPPIRFAAGKTHFPCLLHAFQLKFTPQTSATLYGSQNQLFKALKASYRLCSGQNAFSEPL